MHNNSTAVRREKCKWSLWLSDQDTGCYFSVLSASVYPDVTVTLFQSHDWFSYSRYHWLFNLSVKTWMDEFCWTCIDHVIFLLGKGFSTAIIIVLSHTSIWGKHREESVETKWNCADNKHTCEWESRQWAHYSHQQLCARGSVGNQKGLSSNRWHHIHGGPKWEHKDKTVELFHPQLFFTSLHFKITRWISSYKSVDMWQHQSNSVFICLTRVDAISSRPLIKANHRGGSPLSSTTDMSAPRVQIASTTSGSWLLMASCSAVCLSWVL